MFMKSKAQVQLVKLIQKSILPHVANKVEKQMGLKEHSVCRPACVAFSGLTLWVLRGQKPSAKLIDMCANLCGTFHTCCVHETD